MKRVLVLIFAGLFVTSFAVLAADTNKLVGDARSVDTKYSAPFNVNLEKWFAEHPVEAGENGQTGADISDSASTRDGGCKQGPTFDLHYHTSSDEIVVPIKGQCEQYIDGQWVLMKPGDIHYNPRGVIHSTRLVGNEPFLALSIFTAPPTSGNDRVVPEQRHYNGQTRRDRRRLGTTGYAAQERRPS